MKRLIGAFFECSGFFISAMSALLWLYFIYIDFADRIKGGGAGIILGSLTFIPGFMIGVAIFYAGYNLRHGYRATTARSRDAAQMNSDSSRTEAISQEVEE